MTRFYTDLIHSLLNNLSFVFSLPFLSLSLPDLLCEYFSFFLTHKVSFGNFGTAAASLLSTY
jgi:hypothetical protein